MVIATVLLGTTAAVTVGAAASQHAGSPFQPILWTAGILTALGVIYKALHIGEVLRDLRSLARLSKLQETFLADWNGEPARPGADARPGLPDRIAKIEKQTHEIKGRDAQLVVALEVLADSARDNGAKIDRLDERVIGLDERVTDHRRRNDATAELLRVELERRAAELAVRLDEHNQQVDDRLAGISDNLLHAETMRAALVELGLNVDPPDRQ